MNFKNFILFPILIQTLLFSKTIVLPPLNIEGEYFNNTQDFFIDNRSPVNDIALSKNGHYIISASDDNLLRLWNADKGTLVKRLKGHTDKVLSVAISQNGKYIASGSEDDTIKLWI